jgi:hypothetical protein
MFRKIIIWGFPLHTHTHSYIHYGWHKGFKHLNYDTYWFDDTNVPNDFDFNDCLFITEGYADAKIPIVASSTYFVHIAIRPEKYINKVKRFIEIRYLVDGIKDCNYNYVLDKNRCKKISDCTYYEKLHDNGGLAEHHDNPKPMEYECIYTCWATDLLPHEIKDESVYTEREPTIYWFGSANHMNTKEIALFFSECMKNGIKINVNDPWRVIPPRLLWAKQGRVIKKLDILLADCLKRLVMDIWGLQIHDMLMNYWIRRSCIMIMRANCFMMR